MKEDREEKNVWMTNRERKLQPKQGKFWCWGCDCDLVHQWKKCRTCGTRNSNRINKR